MHLRPSSTVVAIWFLLGAAPTVAGDDVNLAQAIGKGEPVLAFRYRYEDVDDQAVGDKHARASTLRTILGYRTRTWKGLSAYLEAENVTVVGNDLYDNAGLGSLNNGVRDRPVVADPALTELNQAHLVWQGGESAVRIGRQEILLGDQRFVGNVGWRQNHQSFDAVTFTDSSLERVDFFYGYLDTVRRINGGNDETSSHLLNVGIELVEGVKLTLYGYLLDYDDPSRAGLSTSTYGVEIAGRSSLGDSAKLLWELEYADQSDAGDNPKRVDSGYLFGTLGVAFQAITVKIGYEVLEGSPEDGQFSTPLATLHKFNGWADKFLVTPVDGLEDLYLELGGTAGPLDWVVVYHDFSAESGSGDYGSELDLQLRYQSPWKQSFGLKGALYGAEEFARDTDKWMIWTGYRI